MTRKKSPYNRYRTIDNFDEIVMMAVIRLESIAYGVNVYNLIRTADLSVDGTGHSQTKVYAALYLLCDRGLVSCKMMRIDGGIRKCRVYSVTDNGHKVLKRLHGIRRAIEMSIM